VSSKVGLNLGVRSLRVLNHGQFVASAEAVLEEEGRTKAHELTLGHDSDSVAEHVSLVHVMRGQDNNSISTVVLEHVPQTSARAQVHSSGRLVEEHKLRSSAKRKGNGEFPLVAARERSRHFSFIRHKSYIMQDAPNFFLLGLGVSTLEVVEDVHVLFGGELFEEDVVLRADTHELSHFLHVLEHIFVVSNGITVTLSQEAGQHGDSRRLSSSILAKQGKDLARVHLHVDSLHSLEAIRVGLLEFRDLQEFVLELKACNFGGYGLVVLLLEVLDFEVVSQGSVSLVLHERASSELLVVIDNATSTSAVVSAGHEAEAGMGSLTEGLGQDLVKVKA